MKKYVIDGKAAFEIEDIRDAPNDHVAFALLWWGYNPSTDKDGKRGQHFRVHRPEFERRLRFCNREEALSVSPLLANLE